MSPTDDPCLERQWSTPAAMLDSSALMRLPTIAIGRVTTVAGVHIPRYDSTVVGPNPLVSTRTDGITLGRPAGTWTFIAPRIGEDSAGTLHLLWGEPANGYAPVASDDWGDDVSSIWHASFAVGSGWSAAREVLRSTVILWSNDISGTLNAGEQGRLSLATVVENAAVLSARVIEIRDAVAHVHDAPLTNSLRPIGAASAVDGTRLHLAVVARDRGEQDGVYAAYSDDHGRTWVGPGTVVNAAAARTAREVKLVRVANGTLYAVWLDVPRDLRGDSSIRLATTTDGGRTWAVPDASPSLVTPRALSVAVDTCGVVHVVYADGFGGDVHLKHMTWSEGVWSKPVHLFPTLRTASAALGADAGGTVMLVFLAEPLQGPAAAPQTFQSLFRR